MHHLKKVTNFCLYMRYADHKKTLDKYGGPKETISIWAPSHTPHINKNSMKLQYYSSWNNPLEKSHVNPKILYFERSNDYYCDTSDTIV